jgi:hypothetical protein
VARRNRKSKDGKHSARGMKRRTSGSASRARAKTKTKARSKLARKHLDGRKRRPAKVRVKPPRILSLRADPRAEAAVLEMNRGRSLTAAARDSQLSRKQLQNYVTLRRLAKRKGQRWVSKDTRLRQVPVMTRGRFRVLTVRGYEPARLVGEHHHAAGEFVRTNDIKLIKPFRGRTVQAVNGRRYILETDPNALHRIAAMDSPPFHEIYQITSKT